MIKHFFIAIALFLLFASIPSNIRGQNFAFDKMGYWCVQRKGANFFNQTPSSDWFLEAREVGIEFVRLAPDKWKSEQRDFLLGDADEFTEICSQDLQTLKSILDQADRHHVKIVITLLSLPGSRWVQNNQGKNDLRIWQQEKFRNQAIWFWKSLAGLLKDHPAIVGYNILNEPHPELMFGIADYRKIDFGKWYPSVRGSFADLNLFYHNTVRAIREVDDATPIILDTGMYATPWAISYLNPIHDEKVLYSFHMYEPYAYTTRKVNDGRYHYPGSVPLQLEDVEKENLSASRSINWDKEALNDFLHPITQWQQKHAISSAQILVGEFGCDRTVKGAEKYLKHLIEIFNQNNWHWAFYSFREDCWDSMDYELGSGKLSWEYWEAIENGEDLNRFRHDNPLFEVIKADLQKNSLSIEQAHQIQK